MKHRTWKRIAALALALSLALGCAACSNGAGSSASGGVSASGSAPAESASQAQDQIVLTDQAGREVVLEGPAQSIVSCYYISTYAAIALGAEDLVAGLEKKADTRPIYQMAAPELLEKPQVGTMKELDVEATAALEPELVIMPQALADYAGTLTQLGIPVLVVNPESHEALVEMLQLMGTALGLEDRAEALASYYQEQLDRMAELTQDAGAPVVYMGSNSSFLATAPASMYQSTLIRQAGGVNAGDSLEGDYWTEVSYEEGCAGHGAPGHCAPRRGGVHRPGRGRGPPALRPARRAGRRGLSDARRHRGVGLPRALRDFGRHVDDQRPPPRRIFL